MSLLSKLVDYTDLYTYHNLNKFTEIVRMTLKSIYNYENPSTRLVFIEKNNKNSLQSDSNQDNVVFNKIDIDWTKERLKK